MSGVEDQLCGTNLPEDGQEEGVPGAVAWAEIEFVLAWVGCFPGEPLEQLVGFLADEAGLCGAGADRAAPELSVGCARRGCAVRGEALVLGALGEFSDDVAEGLDGDAAGSDPRRLPGLVAWCW